MVKMKLLLSARLEQSPYLHSAWIKLELQLPLNTSSFLIVLQVISRELGHGKTHTKRNPYGLFKPRLLFANVPRTECKSSPLSSQIQRMQC